MGIFHDKTVARKIFRLCTGQISQDRLMDEPPILFESSKQDKWDHSPRHIEHTRWLEACTEVNKTNLEYLSKTEDLGHIDTWSQDDRIICNRIPTFKYLKESDRINGLGSLEGKFNTHTRTLEDLTNLGDNQINEIYRKYASHCRTQLRHAITFAQSRETRIVNGKPVQSKQDD